MSYSCGWEVEGDEGQHMNLINLLFFFFLYSLGQCQQLEESGLSEHYELWEQHQL